MSVSFSRTVRSLHLTDFRSPMTGIGIVLGVFALWCWWFFAAEVPVFEVTEDAWIEAVDSAHRTAAPVSGRVVEANLEIGRWVEKGEPLVVLSGLQTARQLSKEIERREGAGKRLVVLDSIRKVTEEGADAARLGDRKELERARADHQAAVADGRLAFAEVERARRLHAEGLVSDADLERAGARVAQTKAIVLSWEAEIVHLESEIRRNNSERSRALAEIDNRVAALEAEEGIAGLGSDEMASKLEERTISAPISGWLGRVSPLRPGSVLMAGDLVAVVIPDGDLKVSAHFPAGPCLGRIRVGQHARLRLHSMPWMRFGQIGAEVVRVGRETLDGRLRVECRLLYDDHQGLVFQHGMQGILMVEVDRMSPFEMVLTLAGRPWREESAALEGEEGG